MSVIIDGSAGVTTNVGAVYNGLQSATAVTSSSGTSIDFTSIPSWVKRITVMFTNVSLSGTTNYLIQIGAGSVTTTGYTSGSCAMVQGGATLGSTATAGFLVLTNASAAALMTGHIVITNISPNLWVESHTMGFTNTAATASGGGSVGLSGALDRVRITTVNGTDTFDAGSVNIIYE